MLPAHCVPWERQPICWQAVLLHNANGEGTGSVYLAHTSPLLPPYCASAHQVCLVWAPFFLEASNNRSVNGASPPTHRLAQDTACQSLPLALHSPTPKPVTSQPSLASRLHSFPSSNGSYNHPWALSSGWLDLTHLDCNISIQVRCYQHKKMLMWKT